MSVLTRRCIPSTQSFEGPFSLDSLRQQVLPQDQKNRHEMGLQPQPAKSESCTRPLPPLRPCPEQLKKEQTRTGKWPSASLPVFYASYSWSAGRRRRTCDPWSPKFMEKHLHEQDKQLHDPLGGNKPMPLETDETRGCSFFSARHVITTQVWVNGIVCR